MMRNEDIKLYSEFQKSPILFIKKMWGIVPQKVKEEYEEEVKNKPLQEYKAIWFEPFIRGEHITWQQWVILLAVEKSLRGEAVKRISVMSGHGIGKDACVSWLILWYLFCFKDAQVPCTAPSSEQMYDNLWKELALWIGEMPGEIKALYEWQANHIRIRERPETWFARAKTARKETPEALAGIHGRYVFIVADEASGIPDVIYETAEGALTESDILFILIGNPLRRIGYFFESHTTDRKRWQCFSFNSEDSPIVDQEYVDGIISKHGKDSDEYRIRVKGVPPKEENVDEKGWIQLFTEEQIRLAMQDAVHFGQERLGADVADTGEDSSTIIKRSAGYAEILFSSPRIDPMKFAGQIILEKENFNSDLRYIDYVGPGSGVVQRLREQRLPVTGVTGGEAILEKAKYLNKRAEMYWRLREWIGSGGKLSNDNRWLELTKVKYMANSAGKLKIMDKITMRKDKIKSPDHADALALTFFEKEAKQIKTQEERFFERRQRELKRKKLGKGSGYSLRMTN